jgi:hypothetical protein
LTSCGGTIGIGGRGLFLKSSPYLYLPVFSIGSCGVLIVTFGSLSSKTPASIGLMIEYFLWKKGAPIDQSELSSVEYAELQLDLDDGEL